MLKSVIFLSYFFFWQFDNSDIDWTKIIPIHDFGKSVQKIREEMVFFFFSPMNQPSFSSLLMSCLKDFDIIVFLTDIQISTQSSPVSTHNSHHP